jgi:hypothetical protein
MARESCITQTVISVTKVGGKTTSAMDEGYPTILTVDENTKECGRKESMLPQSKLSKRN